MTDGGHRLHEERIVLFSTADWDTALPTNKHHMARRLAARNRVLFVETLGTRAPRAGSADLSRIARRLARSFTGSVKRDTRLWSVSPLVRPKWSTPRDIATNRALFAASAGRSVRAFRPSIAWVYSPFAAHLLPASEDLLVVYHMVDDLAAVPGADARAIREAEAALFARAHLVFCTEKSLHERASRSTPNAHFLPNVADYGHFSKSEPSSGRARTLAARLRALPAPRVLFAGQLASHKVDVKLLHQLARANPAWSFVLVGPIWEADPRAREFEALGRLPNVTATGLVPYADVPAMLHCADVLVIPYAHTGATEAVFPLKLFEYFATGKPVVASASMSSLRPWEPVMALAPNDEASWSDAIRRALVEDGEKASQRRALARRHTWEARLARMEELIAEARMGMRR